MLVSVTQACPPSIQSETVDWRHFDIVSMIVSFDLSHSPWFLFDNISFCNVNEVD